MSIGIHDLSIDGTIPYAVIVAIDISIPALLQHRDTATLTFPPLLPLSLVLLFTQVALAHCGPKPPSSMPAFEKLVTKLGPVPAPLPIPDALPPLPPLLQVRSRAPL